MNYPRCSEQSILLQFTVFTFSYHIFQDFQFEQIYMGLIIQEHFTICHNFMALCTQSISSGLILPRFPLSKLFAE